MYSLLLSLFWVLIYTYTRVYKAAKTQVLNMNNPWSVMCKWNLNLQPLPCNRYVVYNTTSKYIILRISSAAVLIRGKTGTRFFFRCCQSIRLVSCRQFFSDSMEWKSANQGYTLRQTCGNCYGKLREISFSCYVRLLRQKKRGWKFNIPGFSNLTMINSLKIKKSQKINKNACTRA